MRMSLEEYQTRFPNRQPPVPRKYAGQWLAWNEDHIEIVAHGPTLDEVSHLAAEPGSLTRFSKRSHAARSSAVGYEV